MKLAYSLDSSCCSKSGNDGFESSVCLVFYNGEETSFVASLGLTAENRWCCS